MERFAKRLFLFLPVDKRQKLNKAYIKHLNLYRQGVRITSSVRVMRLEKIVAGMACIKIIYPDVSPLIIFCCGVVYYPLITIFNWLLGYYWEASNGWQEEAEWNKHRVNPQRVYIMTDTGTDSFERPGMPLKTPACHE